MSALGRVSLQIALALATYNLLAGALALYRADEREHVRISHASLAESARLAGMASFLAVSAAAFALVWAALTNDFSVSYILHHSNRALPTVYKFAALWSGQEGSLLLWAWLLAGYGFVVRARHRVDIQLTAYASTILAGIQVFFLLLLNIAAQPFRLAPAPIAADGFGLSPLLQYPEMVIHPPMLYLGYVGFSVPFSFALGALMMRHPGDRWIRITRLWTMVTWLFLTCGLFLGAHWAYSVLGWGGYWGWDPVENASLMPWLTATAFLHAVIMQQKRGMMKRWSLWLVFLTFLLTLLGTLLTRSGLVSSVHAFAQSSIGGWFWTFLMIVLGVCLGTYLLHRDHLRSEHPLKSLVSREGSLLLNNMVLLAACFAVLWGTLFPILSEYLQGARVTVGAPFYNRVTIPIALFLILLTGVGPFLAWRGNSAEALRRRFLLPIGAALSAACMLLVAGMQPWQAEGIFYAFIAWTLAAFVFTAILTEFVRGARQIKRHGGGNLLRSMLSLTRRNTRRYGAQIVHFGIVVIVIGIAGSALNQSAQKELGFHQSIAIGPYRLECLNYAQDENLNYDTEYAILDVYRGGRKIAQLTPEKRFYIASQQPSTIVANRSTLAEDLYVVYAGREPDTQHPIVKVFLNPLVAWIWIGVGIVFFGTVVTLLPGPAASFATGDVLAGVQTLERHTDSIPSNGAKAQEPPNGEHDLLAT